MNSFQNALTANEYEMVCNAVELRFKNPEEFKTPEALVIYEQGLMEEEHLFELVKQEYGRQGFTRPLEIPKRVYLPSKIVDYFQDKDCIPLDYDNLNNVMHVAVLPEKEKQHIEKWNGVEIKKHLVPIYYYVDNYTRLYRHPEFLLELPEYDLFNYIVYEAIKLGAAEITLSSTGGGAVYYNVKKTKVNSGKKITRQEVESLCKFLLYKAGVVVPGKHKKPVFFSLELNRHYRGRASMTFNRQGTLLAIRMIENDMPVKGLDILNIPASTRTFIREIFTSDESGLRLLVGPDFSGKSTTIIAALYEKLLRKAVKAVSLEMPVEYAVDCMEQVECLTDEEFDLAAASLLRQSSDIVYIADMLGAAAKAAMNTANSGKAVYATLSANSITDSIIRIHDMTGLALDRIVMGIQSVVFQELVIDNDELKPVNRCMNFSKEYKDSLIGLSREDILRAIRKEEANWA